jgi:phosphate:Na+ symporter
MLNFFNFIAGIALMLYGIRTLRKGADRLFGARLRRILQTATRGNVRALLGGFALSILTPSSTAVALLSVEAIGAGYLAFNQVLAMMLGANIGFTITVQLLAFKFYIFYSVLIAVGAPLFLFAKRQATRGAGQLILGIGFLLLAILLLSEAVAPLKTSAEVIEIMRVLEAQPMWLVGFAVILKVLLQSATATIAIAIALTAQQVLPLSAAIAVVIGTNIGIGVTALIAGFGQHEARKMAVGNLFFKLAGATVTLPFLIPLTTALRAASVSDAHAIANAHTFFNFALAAIFLPLVHPIAKILDRLMPAKAPSEEKFGPRYLHPSALESPALAMGQATRETLRMADLVREMLAKSYDVFRADNLELCEKIQKDDDQIDALNTEIKNYITKISEHALTAEESAREVALLTFANDLESVGDIIDKNLMELAKKKIQSRVQFSAEGWRELQNFFERVLADFDIAVSAFATRDRALAQKLLDNKHSLNEQERELRLRHFHRLHAGLQESIETSAIHLDVLTNLKRINSHLAAVAYPILESQK